MLDRSLGTLRHKFSGRSHTVIDVSQPILLATTFYTCTQIFPQRRHNYTHQANKKTLAFLDLQNAEKNSPISHNKRIQAVLFWSYTSYTLSFGILGHHFGHFGGSGTSNTRINQALNHKLLTRASKLGTDLHIRDVEALNQRPLQEGSCWGRLISPGAFVARPGYVGSPRSIRWGDANVVMSGFQKHPWGEHPSRPTW